MKEQITIVNTPISYVEAGEKLLKEIRQKQASEKIMSKTELKDLIVSRVTDLNGIKATELAADEVLVKVWIEMGKEVDLPDLFEELVEEGRLLEVEYVLSEIPWRAKSFYLPPASIITNIRNSGIGFSGRKNLH